jgi:iron complex transport system substrate-binding protein
LTELGMELPPAVSALEVGPTGYSAVISLEQTAALDADVLLLYAIADEARTALTTSAVFTNLPVSTRCDVLAIEPDVWSALRAPSVLAIPYAVDELVGLITDAVSTD